MGAKAAPSWLTAASIVCCSMLQCVAVSPHTSHPVLIAPHDGCEKRRVGACRRTPTQCVAVCCSSVLQCVAVCCSVLQCVAVCCSMNESCHITGTRHIGPRYRLSVHSQTLPNTAQVEILSNTLQHTATYCNTLQHTATYCPGRHTQNFYPYSEFLPILRISTHVV